MASIFISSVSLDRETEYRLFKELSYKLASRGHFIVQNDVELGKDIESDFKKALNDADVFIFIITEYSINSKLFLNELIQIRNYASHSNNKLLIPIYTYDVDINKLPSSILSVSGIRLENSSIEAIDKAVNRIDDSINSFLGKKIATDEKAQEIKEKIEHSAPEYISQTLNELTKRETSQKRNALFWYIMGFLSLVSGVGVWFSNNGLSLFDGQENWSMTIFYAIKSIFIIVLLIAASKYSFNLAKSYMSESLKISDRIHAISFGKFYLQVFNQQIDPNEIKEIFRDWNINNQINTFSNQTSSDYDPKLLENISQLIDKIKGTEKK